LLFEADDPDGDDNGPGKYAYPTDPAFHAGAYDLQQFQVFDLGDDVEFRVRTRDLTATFGSPLGAQMVDVYVHDPAATATSTAASFPQRNYAFAAPGAWSRGFTPTPQAFQFGVCAAASADPHCTFDPAGVPKAMAVVTPAGTPQSDELDDARHAPVTIAPVLMP
jgi:hypothetical protein